MSLVTPSVIYLDADQQLAKLTEIKDKLTDVISALGNLGESQQVGGSVAVSNLPATQPVSGNVAVSNFPATQEIEGSVAISNFPATQQVGGDVSVSNFPATQQVSGSVAVSNLPATQPVSGNVAVSNFPATQQVGGSVAVSNLPATQQVGGDVSVSNFPATQPVSGNVAVSNFPTSQVVNTASGVPLSINDTIASSTEFSTSFAANQSLLGASRDTNGTKNKVRGWVFTDVNGTLTVEQSVDNSTFRQTHSFPITGSTLQATTFEFDLISRWFKLRYTNGATAQTVLQVIRTMVNIGA